jgi:hypothetical protein
VVAWSAGAEVGRLVCFDGKKERKETMGMVGCRFLHALPYS